MGATALTDRCHQTARCFQIGGVHIWVEERNPASSVDSLGFTPLIPASLAVGCLLADVVGGRVDVAPHPRKVVFPFAGVQRSPGAGPLSDHARSPPSPSDQPFSICKPALNRLSYRSPGG